MQLQIRHETRYVYEDTVSYSIQSLRLTPRSDPGQRILSWRISTPGDRHEQVDAFGNLTHIVTVEAPHREMRIVVEGVADIDEEDRGYGGNVTGEIAPLAFLAPTALTRADRAVREIAERHLGHHPPKRATLLDLVSGVQRAVVYEPGITDVGHSAIEALDLGVGVCQDQAHVFIACCRAAGVPARYVSGYLYTGESGEVASHAWADAWLGEEEGWVSLDVTHGEAAGVRHCRLALGRDYFDAAPVRGVRRGGGREEMTVAVKLAPFLAQGASLAQQHQQQ
jgi:transglutaminase-like putative cysteine protease